MLPVGGIVLWAVPTQRCRQLTLIAPDKMEVAKWIAPRITATAIVQSHGVRPLMVDMVSGSSQTLERSSPAPEVAPLEPQRFARRGPPLPDRIVDAHGPIEGFEKRRASRGLVATLSGDE